MDESAVVWLSDIREEGESVGARASFLSKMMRNKIPSLPGFAVKKEKILEFIRESDLESSIKAVLTGLNAENEKEIDETSERLREIILNAELPKSLVQEIEEAYEMLSVPVNGRDLSGLDILEKSDSTKVWVCKSSLNDEVSAELPNSVIGKDEVINEVKNCIASCFDVKNIKEYARENSSWESLASAVIIQKAVPIRTSGTVKHEDSKGKISVSAGNSESEEKFVLQRTPEEVSVKEARAKNEKQTLSAYEAKKLALHAEDVEKIYGKKHDLQFVSTEKNVYILSGVPAKINELEDIAEKEMEKEVIQITEEYEKAVEEKAKEENTMEKSENADEEDYESSILRALEGN